MQHIPRRIVFHHSFTIQDNFDTNAFISDIDDIENTHSHCEIHRNEAFNTEQFYILCYISIVLSRAVINFHATIMHKTSKNRAINYHLTALVGKRNPICSIYLIVQSINYNKISQCKRVSLIFQQFKKSVIIILKNEIISIDI